MSSIVPVTERPSFLFIEGFWTILEGSYLVFKVVILLLRGASMQFAAIILNAGLPFAIINTALTYITAL